MELTNWNFARVSPADILGRTNRQCRSRVSVTSLVAVALLCGVGFNASLYGQWASCAGGTGAWYHRWQRRNRDNQPCGATTGQYRK